jgi:site-specific DNA-methyltransferase (adenine-specific)
MDGSVIYHETEHGILYHGDCLDIFPTLADKSVDLVLTDPPYGTTACKWDIVVEFRQLWSMLYHASKDSAPCIMTASEPFCAQLICSNIRHFRHEWIWDKVSGANFLNIKNQPLKTHEKVIVFSRSSRYTFNPQMVLRSPSSLKRDPIGTSRIIKSKSLSIAEHYGVLETNSEYQFRSDGKKHPISIIRHPIIEKGRYTVKHPTKKPVSLFSYMIKTFSNHGDTVFDPFAGSGTTAIACIRLGRKYILIEKEEKYCEIAVRRIESEIDQNTIDL